MKKAFLMAAVALSTVNASAQDGSWRKTEDPAAFKHSITINFSAMGFFGNEARSFGAIGLEYDRVLPRRWSVGAVGLYAPICHEGQKAGEWPKDGAFWFAGARASYTLPVVRGWLYFRVGAGAGIGVQHRNESAWQGEVPVAVSDIRIMPHLIVDGNWILRVSRRVDLRFSPLIVYPTQYIFGLGSSLHRSGGTKFEYANMFPFGATVRF